MLSLVYGIVAYAVSAATLLRRGLFAQSNDSTGANAIINTGASAIITLVSYLLLTLIILEAMTTVVRYFQSREKSASNRSSSSASSPPHVASWRSTPGSR
jgi:hypothetical protein